MHRLRQGDVLTRPGKIFCRWAVLFTLFLFLFCSCVPLEKMDKASGTIVATDYLHSLSGIYEALLQPKTGDAAIITLLLYPDGSGLFSEKTIGGPAEGLVVSTGRWDHSDFSNGVTLHLKSKGGVRRVMQCSPDKSSGSLTCVGPGYGPAGLTLIKR